MKNTLYLSILAAALVGSQVFANYIPTTTDAKEAGDNNYAGAFSQSGDASNANVTINEEEEGGDDFSEISVYGGLSKKGSADGNSVTMTGGQVFAVYGGSGKTGTVSNNKVTVSGGQLFFVIGGGIGNGTASNNTVIISGAQVSAAVEGAEVGDVGDAVGNAVYLAGGEIGDVVGANVGTGSATNNHVHLVGAGASVTVNGGTVDGHSMQVGSVYVAMASGTMTGNSIEVYGTEITASTLSSMQMLNFHIADGVLLSQEAMVSLTSTKTSGALDLTGVEIGFSAADVQDWGKYEGQSITLVNAAQAITVGEGSLGDVEIKGADGLTVATATLALENSDKSLVLSNIKGTAPVPEPTTGTLSLLALAGLCARRRRK